MIPKCPKCGNKKLEKTRKGYNIRCANPWCGYLSEKMTKEQVLEIINYKPTILELALEEIEFNSKYIYEENDDYITVDDAKEIIMKYFSKKDE